MFGKNRRMQTTSTKIARLKRTLRRNEDVLERIRQLVSTGECPPRMEDYLIDLVNKDKEEAIAELRRLEESNPG